MLLTLIAWYVVVQLVTLATLPLALRTMGYLPDRGYGLAKAFGILLVGVVLWLATSYGLLRNDRGGAWLVLLGTAAAVWGSHYRSFLHWLRELAQTGNWRVIAAAEVLFAGAFVIWAVVRAYDPAANHTEQPMDLMFMNSIWGSTAFPPQDAWLAGYGVSYYYLGYWLLVTLGRLANVAPEVAYNVGQASWYGLLWLGSFTVVTNLLAYRFDRLPNPRDSNADDLHAEDNGTDGADVLVGRPAAGPTGQRDQYAIRYAIRSGSLGGGVLAAVMVAAMGNLQVILEWLYAQGANLSWLIRWVDVPNFPENAVQTGDWYISYNWWWWRTSRVIGDTTLSGGHSEVIDEFPMFSYLLGDNHPHVLAMPFVLLVIGLAFNYLLRLMSMDNAGSGSGGGRGAAHPLHVWRDWLGPWWHAVVLAATAGALVFLNTWDFPPYWALIAGVAAAAMWVCRQRIGGALWIAGGTLAGTFVLYLPYFLTAQSQVSGLVPNMFYPTRLPQFLLMFGGFAPSLVLLARLTWRTVRPKWTSVGLTIGALLGLAVAFLVVSAVIATGSEAGRAALMHSVGIPEGGAENATYAGVMLRRWLLNPWTLLLVSGGLGVMLAMGATLLARQRMLQDASHAEAAPTQDGVTSGRTWAGGGLDTLFVLLLAVIGLGLVLAPEVIYLRDFFGTRMNTIFKFYYQAWLLFGLVSAYAVTVVLRQTGGPLDAGIRLEPVLAGLSLLTVGACLLFPVAGVYSKTGGFRAERPTLDTTAYVAESGSDAGVDVMAAVAWIKQNTVSNALVLEGKGASYSAGHNRISTMTGRPTLLGWDGHESQWRGDAYPAMAQGRTEAIQAIYAAESPEVVADTLAAWGIDYVFVGPTEIADYGLTDASIARLGEAMDPVFARENVHIFRRRPLTLEFATAGVQPAQDAASE